MFPESRLMRAVSGRRARWCLGFAALVLGLAWLGDGRRERVGKGGDDVAARLRAAASAARASLAGVRGDELARRRAEAMRAYETLANAAEVPRAQRALAWFRLGEIARAAGEPARARTAFLRVLAAATGDLSHRARLEIGHLERRTDRYEAAALHYEELVRSAADAPYLQDEAMFWLARVRRLAERPCTAVPLLRALVARSNRSTVRARAERELARAEHEGGCE